LILLTNSIEVPVPILDSPEVRVPLIKNSVVAVDNVPIVIVVVVHWSRRPPVPVVVEPLISVLALVSLANVVDVPVPAIETPEVRVPGVLETIVAEQGLAILRVVIVERFGCPVVPGVVPPFVLVGTQVVKAGSKPNPVPVGDVVPKGWIVQVQISVIAVEYVTIAIYVVVKIVSVAPVIPHVVEPLVVVLALVCFADSVEVPVERLWIVPEVWIPGV